MPQAAVHGSLHLLLTQAKSCEQSVLCTHSGLQLMYGSPIKSGGQVHEPALFLSVHIALVPQGVGSQGNLGSSVTAKI